jgi:hypothetical protein
MAVNAEVETKHVEVQNWSACRLLVNGLILLLDSSLPREGRARECLLVMFRLPVPHELASQPSYFSFRFGSLSLSQIPESLTWFPSQIAVSFCHDLRLNADLRIRRLCVQRS